MFGFLKDKLKKAISKFTGDVEKEVEEKVEKKVEKEAVSKPKDEKKEIPSKKELKPEKKEVEKHKETKKEEKKHVEEIKEKEKSKKETSKIKHEEKKPVENIKHVEKEIEHKDTDSKTKIIPERKEEKKIHDVKKHEETKHHIPHSLEKHEAKEELSKHHAEISKNEIKTQEIDVSEKEAGIKKHEDTKHHAHISKKNEIKTEEKEKPKSGFFSKLKNTFVKKEEPKLEKESEKKDDETLETKNKISEKEEKTETNEDKKGFFEKLTEVVTKKTLSESKFDELFFELEIAMLENNVALEVIEKIKNDLKKSLLSEKVSRMKTEEIIANSLRDSINDLFDIESIDLLKEANKKKPYVICFIGVNGSGKTTNLAKLANYFQKNGLSVVIAACDTFRAAAIQQIEEHSKKLDIKLIKHDYGADAAAVAFDAIEHAKAKQKDIVLIDTAGRSHANVNLMEELEKVIRVSKPDFKIFVGDSLTGNDAVDQAKTFNEKVGIDGIILTKVDVDEKGGAAISVSYITKKPILFIGNGQTYDDLEEFDKEKIIKNIGL